MAPDAFVRIDDQRSLCGLRVVILEDRFLRGVICPAPGARARHFEHDARGTVLPWHDPRTEHLSVPIGASDDDNFTTTVGKCGTLHADRPHLHRRHRITSHRPRGLDVHWQLQPALAIEGGESLDYRVRAVLCEGREPLRGFTDDGKALR